MGERGSVDPGKLLLLWTTADREVALNMIFMYAGNARRQEWWDRVRIVVWGPSARILAVDEQLRSEVADLQDAGVDVQACRRCADEYGVSDDLEALGIEVKYMGEPLSDMLKQDWYVLTF